MDVCYFLSPLFRERSPDNSPVLFSCRIGHTDESKAVAYAAAFAFSVGPKMLSTPEQRMICGFSRISLWYLWHAKIRYMKIDAKVRSISKLKDYFFLVPDYQREYVWKPNDQVEQFLLDIEGEYLPGARDQRNYFIGSIIVVKNDNKSDVVDGQQRLTTIMLCLCAFRNILKTCKLDVSQMNYLHTIDNLLHDFDIESGENRIRLELQYEESSDFLTKMIREEPYEGILSPSIIRMQEAYDKIMDHFRAYGSVDELIAFAIYYLTRIELVIIESQDLGSALKIFETINQRGAGLNAMDLVKNLLFSHTKEEEFARIKDIWKEIIHNLQACYEEQSPLRFLRYFLISRYTHGNIREDDIYKWIISPEGKAATGYETDPVGFAKEIRSISKRYAELVAATELQQDGGAYPHVTNIGFINKYKSRQHLILLLSLGTTADRETIEYLAEQIESYFFFSSTLHIKANTNESLFVQWAEKLRGLTEVTDVAVVIDKTMLPYLAALLGPFKTEFEHLHAWVYYPLYRLRYVLGKIENTMLDKSNLPQHGHDFYNNLQIEHIFPQTPHEDIVPAEFADMDEYYRYVNLLGNTTLLEGIINAAVNHCNRMTDDHWFQTKQLEYGKSSVCMARLLNADYYIGNDTALNRFKDRYGYLFDNWNKASVAARQKILMELAFDTWRINRKRLDSEPAHP